MVRKGQGGPTVVVLDPSGDAKHDELPATWRALAEQVEVVWWRLPAAERDTRSAGLLDGIDRTYLVGAGSAALLTLSLAVSHRAQVRCVVLVDPPWPVADLPYVRRIVSHRSLPIEQVDTASGDLPIGHPDVVSAVVRALAAADPADRARRGLPRLTSQPDLPGPRVSGT